MKFLSIFGAASPVFFPALLATTLVSSTTTGSAADASVTPMTFSFKRGVNISHWLAQHGGERPYGAPWFDAEDVAWIAVQGFDHIRIPVDGREWLLPDGGLDDPKIVPFEQAMGWARERGLGIILDMHFLPGASFDPGKEERAVFTDDALQAKVADFWRKVALRYAGEGDYLRFEILNEPVAMENQQVNPFNRRMLAAIRESNPTRVVYLTTNRWSSFDTITDLEVPEDRHLAITIHNYEPFVFTHQRASWGGFPPEMPRVPFPGTVPDLKGTIPGNRGIEQQAGRALTVADLDARFAKVAAWAAQHAPNVEFHVGEFGVYQPVDADSKRNWIRAIRHACERHGWGWAVWDYQGGFAVRDREGNPTPILEGLFDR